MKLFIDNLLISGLAVEICGFEAYECVQALNKHRQSNERALSLHIFGMYTRGNRMCTRVVRGLQKKVFHPLRPTPVVGRMSAKNMCLLLFLIESGPKQIFQFDQACLCKRRNKNIGNGGQVLG